MRILLLSWEFPPHVVGGLGKHVADLTPALTAQGIEVHVVTPQLRGGAETEEICSGLIVHRVPLDVAATNDIVVFSHSSNGSLEQKGRELSAEYGGFDLIHGHDWLIAHSSVALKYTLKRPLVVTVHSMERGRMQGTINSEQSRAIDGTEWWLTYEAWRVITVSHYMARQVRTFFGIPSDKLDVIYNGVTMPHIERLVEPEFSRFRSAYAQPHEQIVLSVGRIVHEKGVQVLIEAVPQILRQQPHTKFVIAGTGPYLPSLQALAHERGVADHCIFTGFIPDDVRDKLYQVADVAVIPSLYEPFGIVALEAMSYGCPVIVSETGGLAEVVRAHETGILTRPGDPASLAWGILHSLLHAEWSQKRAANALRDVEEIYNWRNIATQTIATYQRTLDGLRGSAWGDGSSTA